MNANTSNLFGFALTSGEYVEECASANLIALGFDAGSRGRSLAGIRSTLHHHLEGRVHDLLGGELDDYSVLPGLCRHIGARVGVISIRVGNHIALSKWKMRPQL